MNKKEFITFEQALDLHFTLGSDPALIFHSHHVTFIANKILNQLQKNQQTIINKQIILIGAFLHDIGRTESHGIKHGIIGAEIVLHTFPKNDFSISIANIAARHIGGGIPINEAIELGLPARDYIPTTLEEKIVCYADKLADYQTDKRNNEYIIKKWFTFNNADNEIKKLSAKLGNNHPVIDRLNQLERDLIALNQNKKFNFQNATKIL
jgi:uncharacterized protein